MGNSVGFKKKANIIAKAAVKVESKENASNKDEAAKVVGTAQMLEPELSLDQLDIKTAIGDGTFATVYLVQSKRSHNYYALKAMPISKLTESGQQEHAVRQKEILRDIDNIFCVKLLHSMKDSNYLYYLFDVVYGGELFRRLKDKNHRVGEREPQFIAAQVVLAFEYLHSKDIIFRNLKPECILQDTNGYIKLCGFLFAKKVTTRTYTLCGTPDYLAPEVVTGMGQGKPVDWWSLGILIYELLVGIGPFYDEEPTQTFTKIIRGNITYPANMRDPSKQIIQQLLNSKPDKRLVPGIKELKEMPFFDGLNFEAIANQTAEPPYKAKFSGPGDTSNFDCQENTTLEKSDIADTNDALFADF